jgi:beta-glucuronidase
MLFPIENKFREIKPLSGLWRFRIDHENCGIDQEWYKNPLRETSFMAVPASYNELTQDPAVRNHIGLVWYEREFFIPEHFQKKSILIRLDGIPHHSTVWINGQKAAENKGGFLPFEADITAICSPGHMNRITLAVDNRLTLSTLPPGRVVMEGGDMQTGQEKTFTAKSNQRAYPPGYTHQEQFHDFANYSGIHRTPLLLAVPEKRIENIVTSTTIEGASGLVRYESQLCSGGKDLTVRARLLDPDGNPVAEGTGVEGTLSVSDPQLWAPGQPHLYRLELNLSNSAGTILDTYTLEIGIRTVEVRGDRFLINGRPFYFRGFGRHEDADLVGKGHSDVVMLKDFGLMNWTGANSFRTSHYPYAEEQLIMADRLGVVVIDEAPAVGLSNIYLDGPAFSEDNYGADTLAHHLEMVRRMIARDRNHPSVVMWSLGNEAAAGEPGALPYFTEVVNTARNLDSTRPITVVDNIEPEQSCLGDLVDVVCINRYFSWYADCGHLEVIDCQIEDFLQRWRKRAGKPIFVTEYGADSIAGFHSDPPVMFSEEYQCELLRRYHAVFDRLDFVIGEHVWNLADFATEQGITRVGGNRKGVFTRNRQPKMAAHVLRERWSAHADSLYEKEEV